MNTNIIINGLAYETVKSLPDKSVNCVITSPPYWQLRDYGFADQWGLEPTFQLYLEHLWLLMDEIYRILTDDGTVWINLGDSYASNSGAASGGYGTHYIGEVVNNSRRCRTNSIPAKSQLLIPHRFAIGCIDRGWIIRNDIIWAKRNGLPESVKDRFRKSHEYIFFMVKKQKYYFDLDSIRDKYIDDDRTLRNKGAENYARTTNNISEGVRNWWSKTGKNPGDVSDFWDIPTQPSSEKHYATYNFDLIDKPIIAGCPEGGIILDPFAGTGTTLVRAIQLNRQGLGIEGNPEYAAIATKRIEQELSQIKLFTAEVI